MDGGKRLALMLLAAACAASGCSSWRTQTTADQLAAASPEVQRKFFEERKGTAKFVPGKGYYVAQVGYFDEQGKLTQKDDSPAPETIRRDRAEENDDETLLGGLAPSSVSRKIRKVWVGEPNEGIARGAFVQAEELFKQKRYSEAQAQYQTAADRWPDSALEEDALFMIGECQFFTDRYPQAEESYGRVLKKYANSEYLDQINRRRYAIAQYWQSLHAKNPKWVTTPNVTDKSRPTFDTHGRAMKAYESVMRDNVRGPLADDAVMSVAQMYFEKGFWDDADFRYTMLIRDYPQSKHQYLAHDMSLRCKFLKYKMQGADYNGAALDEAEDLVNQMLVQFPQEMPQHQTDLQTKLKEVHALKAERDWKLAEYYASNEYYRAARMYYQKLVEDYPKSSFADQSRERLANIQNQPDVPEHPLAWMQKVVPKWPGTDAPSPATASPESRGATKYLAGFLHWMEPATSEEAAAAQELQTARERQSTATSPR